MQIVVSKNDLDLLLENVKKQGKSLGFVPTMGALHKGHISLIDASKKNSNITVCSIFVNPTQFNDKSDLERYPRMPEKDAALLEKAGCDVLFLPDVNEIYPKTDSRKFDFGYLDKILEGAHRPGHFNGVAQVVSILFDIVKPDKAFFGLKDYQQVLIIRELKRQLELPVEIVACPIERESDGLAMSSRNMLLSPQERSAAALIPALLKKAKQMKGLGRNVQEITLMVKSELSKNQIYNLDYFYIGDVALKETNTFVSGVNYIALIACFVGKVRLIDNLFLD